MFFFAFFFALFLCLFVAVFFRPIFCFLFVHFHPGCASGLDLSSVLTALLPFVAGYLIEYMGVYGPYNIGGAVFVFEFRVFR